MSVKVQDCPWCGGTGKNPLFDIPDPINCRVCYGKGIHISEWQGNQFIQYDPRTWEKDDD